MKENKSKNSKKVAKKKNAATEILSSQNECQNYSMDKDKMTKYANAMYQNAGIGMQSVNDLLPSVQDCDLYDELKQEYVEFRKIREKLLEESNVQQITLKENNFFKKSRLWISIKCSTLFNKESRHIAEMMTIGTIMGLNDVYKAHADNKCVNKELDNIADELEKLMERNYSNLKTFIKMQKK